MPFFLETLLITFLIQTTFASSIPTAERRATSSTARSDGSPTFLKNGDYEANWTDVHGNGTSNTTRDEHIRGNAVYQHGVKAKGEEHRVKSGVGIGKHAVEETEGVATKHADTSSALGKDVKAKTFGYFDYRYKEPEYHIERYYTDEKYGQKFDSNRHHRTIKDHSSDMYEASGWDEYGNGYVNDARELNTYEIAAHEQVGRKTDHYRGYGNKSDKIESYHHDSTAEDYTGNYPDYDSWSTWNRRQQDGWENDGWFTPDRHAWERNYWADRRPNGWEQRGWEETMQQPSIESRTQRGSRRRTEPSWDEWNQRPTLWSEQTRSWN